MARTSQSLSYKDIVGSIRKGDIAPVYILMGVEEYFIDSIVKLLEERVVESADKDFNTFIFYGADADIETVANTSRQYPLMSERQLVILKEAQTLDRAKTQLEKLSPYIENPVQTTVLVIAFKGDELSASSRVIKAAGKGGGIVFQSARVKENNIGPYVKDYCEAAGVRIDSQAIAMLSELQGTELKKIFSEIDKIIVAGKGAIRNITRDHVCHYTGVNKEYNNFELTSALAVKNYAKAMEIVEFFSKNPRQNSPMKSISLLFSFYSKLVIAGCLKYKRDTAIMTALNARSEYSIREIKAAMKFYSLRQSVACISLIRDFDCQSKGIGSMRNEFDLFRELMFKLVSI